MSTANSGSWVFDLLNNVLRDPAAPRSAPDPVLEAVLAARKCAELGHQYQVHGKTNPSKVSCKRCRVSWGIGPRTEPPTP